MRNRLINKLLIIAHHGNDFTINDLDPEIRNEILARIWLIGSVLKDKITSKKTLHKFLSKASKLGVISNVAGPVIHKANSFIEKGGSKFGSGVFGGVFYHEVLNTTSSTLGFASAGRSIFTNLRQARNSGNNIQARNIFILGTVLDIARLLINGMALANGHSGISKASGMLFGTKFVLSHCGEYLNECANKLNSCSPPTIEQAAVLKFLIDKYFEENSH